MRTKLMGAMPLWLVLAALVTVGVMEAATSEVKVQHLGEHTVVVSCKNGGDPTVNLELQKAVGERTLVVSCGR